MSRTVVYGGGGGSHGSPQISFKLSAYEALGLISANAGGDAEDLTTSRRLVHHFGNLQEGALFHDKIFSVTTLTGDRLDGSFDSSGRKSGFEREGLRDIGEGVSSVLGFRDRLLESIDALPEDQRLEWHEYLQAARVHYQKEEKVQQRFNRLVLDTFITAIEQGLVAPDEDGEWTADDAGIAGLRGGAALRHYMDANPQVVSAVVHSPGDLAVMRYLLGREHSLPEGVTELTPFQRAIREYVGEFSAADELLESDQIRYARNGTDVNGYSTWQIDDLRPANSRISFMHGFVAEALAATQVDRALFEAQHAQTSAASPDDRSGGGRWQLYDLGSQSDRVDLIRSHYPLISDTESAQQSTTSQISAPVAVRGLTRRLFRRR